MARTAIEKPTGWLKLVLAFVLAFFALFLQALAYFLPIEDDLTFMAVGEVIGGIAALLFVVALGGRNLLRPSMRGIGLAFKLAAALFIADGAITLVGAVGTFAEGQEIMAGWLQRTVVIAIACIGIGATEEGIFRGLLLHGLLGRMGTTRKGVFGAIVITSVLFGLVHVFPDPTLGTDPLSLAQAALKVGQTGLMGFMMGVIVVTTGNLWLAVILHALNDFMLLFVEIGLLGMEFEIEYVATGEDAVSIIVLYTILCVCYMPSVVMSARHLLRTMPAQASYRGAFWRPMGGGVAAAYVAAQGYATPGVTSANEPRVHPLQPYMNGSAPIPPERFLRSL